MRFEKYYDVGFGVREKEGDRAFEHDALAGGEGDALRPMPYGIRCVADLATEARAR